MTKSSPSTGATWRSVFDVTATVLVLFAAGLVLWRSSPPSKGATITPPKPPDSPLVIGNAPARGASTAKIAIVEYSDFECPFCGVAARNTLKTLQSSYIDNGQVTLVFKHFPLPKHSHAKDASAAAICAGSQGKYWEMHDLLFANQEKMTDGDLPELARKLDLKIDLFNNCRKAAETVAAIEADVAEGKAIGVSGTPTFFVGAIQPDGKLRATNVVVGARPLTEFTDIIEALLSKGLSPTALGASGQGFSDGAWVTRAVFRRPQSAPGVSPSGSKWISHPSRTHG